MQQLLCIFFFPFKLKVHIKKKLKVHIKKKDRTETEHVRLTKQAEELYRETHL